MIYVMEDSCLNPYFSIVLKYDTYDDRHSICKLGLQ